MAYRLQVQIPVELAEAVKEAAKADRRSMASWVALRLEEAVAGVARGENPHLPPDYREALEALSPVASASNTDRPSRVQGAPKGARALCPHDSVTKKPGASGGLVKTCSDCGEVLLR